MVLSLEIQHVKCAASDDVGNETIHFIQFENANVYVLIFN